LADLKSILRRIEFKDDAKVVAQLAAQHTRVMDRMAGIQHKVLVMSGKGGVGKSTVTAQLGLSLARRGLAVGILDADLNGPSIPHMLGLGEHGWQADGAEVEPIVGPHGLRVASMSFFLKMGEPIRWSGPTDLSHVWLGMLESGTLREFLGDINWGKLDVLLVDMPPGAAADKPPAILRFIPDADGALFVTTPSSVTRSVVTRSMAYAEDLGLPVLGTVENFADLFGSEDNANSPIQRIPYDLELARSLDSGAPLADSHPTSTLFGQLADTLMEKIR
jgi:ATP-binding protein involved in chromosome partitioning